MAKQKTEKPVVEVKKDIEVDLKIENSQINEMPKESIEVEVVESRSLSGEENIKKVKLVPKKVFEPMQMIHKTVWVSGEE